MFYSHGGGFTTGSAAPPIRMAAISRARGTSWSSQRTTGSVSWATCTLATWAARNTPRPGNQGLLDIRDGMKWVTENIERFGGDPHNVMIFGESGGGAKTSCLYAMPSAAPYFNKASIESGPAIRIYAARRRRSAALRWC